MRVDTGCLVALQPTVSYDIQFVGKVETALFGGEGARRAAGAIVPFVLWFNFIGGFAYVACGLGLWGRRRRTCWPGASSP